MNEPNPISTLGCNRLAPAIESNINHPNHGVAGMCLSHDGGLSDVEEGVAYVVIAGPTST